MAYKNSLEDARDAFRKQLRPFAGKKPVKCICSSCRMTIPTDLQWSCGYCGFSNRRTDVYSFLNECQKCGKEPKSIVCPDCESPNFLDKDFDSSHAAYKTVQPIQNSKAESPQAVLDREHKERVAQLNREIDIAKKKAELRHAEDTAVRIPEMTEHEKAVEELVARAKKILRFEAAAPDARAKLQEAFKNTPAFETKIDEVLSILIAEQDGMR
jgi:hypothetical protein